MSEILSSSWLGLSHNPGMDTSFGNLPGAHAIKLYGSLIIDFFDI